MSIETTLVLFKPDALEKNLPGTIISRFLDAGLSIRAIKMMQLNEAILREHYAHVADQPFFPGLMAFMSKRPIIALALSGSNAISLVRDLLGPTNSSTAPAGTIRGDFGENSMANICHASDSPESATIELQRFFKPEEIFLTHSTSEC